MPNEDSPDEFDLQTEKMVSVPVTDSSFNQKTIRGIK